MKSARDFCESADNRTPTTPSQTPPLNALFDSNHVATDGRKNLTRNRITDNSTIQRTGVNSRRRYTAARISPLDDPENVLATPEGLLITDGWNGRVIRVDGDGVIRLVAGRSDGSDCSALWGRRPYLPDPSR